MTATFIIAQAAGAAEHATAISYGLYLLISIALTIWVARTLHRNGRVFLIDAFNGNETLADSVNHLLVVGFYLINAGYIALALRYGEKPTGVREAIEFLSTKIGLVLVVLGAMHFFNLYVFSRMRRRSRAANGSNPDHAHQHPPVVPDEKVNPATA
jgi:hypothetical protein